MKRIISFLLCFSLLAVFAACGAEAVDPKKETVPVPTETTTPLQTTMPTDPPASYRVPLAALSAPVSAQTFTDDDGNVVFSYTWQDITLTLEDPQIAEAVVIDFLNLVDFEKTAAPSVLAEAQQAVRADGSRTPYSYSITYNTQRFDSGVLSLYGTQAVYNGNPRPAIATTSVNYDLLTGRRLALKDILQEDFSADALSALIIQSLSGLSSEGVLFSDHAYVISEMFATNTPVQTWYFSDSGLCFYFAPYEIAPYSAGTIVAEVPYSELVGLLKYEYFPEEVVLLSGTVAVRAFDDTAASGFSQFAELIVDSSAKEYLLYTDGAVRNLRLVWKNTATDSSSSDAGITLFSAAMMCTSDAFVFQIPEKTLSELELYYEADGNSFSCVLSELIP